jgi:23S rRNA (cytidine1920-2'-O)/16S rRNA (cytidine1409-2'-O)-methyltransferase
MRLDEALKDQGLVSSREKAKSLILSGHVKVNGEIIKKPSTLVTDEALEVSKTLYVSRSAEKLLEALNRWNLDLNDQVVLDIGASTGGFTQVALEKGAKSVLALDVGSNQLDPLLLKDSRVINLENIHFLKTNRSDFAAIDTTLIDVSFISSLKILAHALTVLDCPQYLVLFKPQFETEAPQKDHIVKEKKRLALKSAWFDAVKAMGFTILESCDVTPGKKGNQETMVYLQVK